jgi:hypothetical protein
MKTRTWTRMAIALVLAASSGPVLAAEFQAGVGRVTITPPQPFWMSGYAARTHPSDGVYQELWAKALALRDEEGHQAVLVTTDLIGPPRAISDNRRAPTAGGMQIGVNPAGPVDHDVPWRRSPSSRART